MQSYPTEEVLGAILSDKNVSAIQPEKGGDGCNPTNN